MRLRAIFCTSLSRAGFIEAIYVGASWLVYRSVSFAKFGSDFSKILVPSERPKDGELKYFTILAATRNAEATYQVRSTIMRTRQ